MKLKRSLIIGGIFILLVASFLLLNKDTTLYKDDKTHLKINMDLKVEQTGSLSKVIIPLGKDLSDIKVTLLYEGKKEDGSMFENVFKILKTDEVKEHIHEFNYRDEVILMIFSIES
ncbi:MAG: hypothetical protein GX038_02220 [Erysipelothrix sp.]|nr:hypothetical protein [Erysipelothrix sp.]